MWRFGAPLRMISSAPFGGGIGRRSWVLNANVPPDYSRLDPDVHVREIASTLSLSGEGTGMLTAASVRHAQQADDNGARVCATVGLRQPTRAAAPEPTIDEAGDETVQLVGTINIVAWLPVALAPAALVNAVSTVAEAKAQALFDCGVAGTGTATDAVVIACLDEGREEAFGGPRSTWGSRLARAVHAAVVAGAHP